MLQERLEIERKIARRGAGCPALHLRVRDDYTVALPGGEGAEFHGLGIFRGLTVHQHGIGHGVDEGTTGVESFGRAFALEIILLEVARQLDVVFEARVACLHDLAPGVAVAFLGDAERDHIEIMDAAESLRIVVLHDRVRHLGRNPLGVRSGGQEYRNGDLLVDDRRLLPAAREDGRQETGQQGQHGDDAMLYSHISIIAGLLYPIPVSNPVSP